MSHAASRTGALHVGRSFWVTVAMAGALAACASVGGMRSAPLEQGVVRHYDAELYDAVLAARAALGGSQLEIEEVRQVDDRTWYIIAKRSSGEWTHGELIRVVCEEMGERDVAIRILTRRRVGIEFTAKGDWSEELFTQIALELSSRG
ncbi:MAG: hypothetical protein JSW71_02295 [Gemmatimonadota bacterium]|nr:MAG: hypothetical protein JSW71_02295 [Gemmatimonadota bacterium]